MSLSLLKELVQFLLVMHILKGRRYLADDRYMVNNCQLKW